MIRLNFFGDFVANNINLCTISDVLRAKLQNADYNIVNFEAPIQTNSNPSLKSGPSLQQDAISPYWLHTNGFEIFTLANNHIMDYGKDAALVTAAKLGMDKTIGFNKGKDAYKPLIIDKNGIKVAIFSLAELQFGIIHDTWTQKDEYGCAWINHSYVNKIIREKKQEVDFVVVVAHAGLEGVDVPLPEWRDRYRELIDVGCDVVVGGHTHIAQGYEIYKGRPIFYSLGNFCFQDNLSGKENWNIGECVSLSLSQNGKISFNVYGTQFVDGKCLTLMNIKDWDLKLNQLIGTIANDKYMDRINSICLYMLDDYNQLFSMGGYIHFDKHILKSIIRWLCGRCKDVHILNNLQCESHRWAISRGLRIKNNIN